jgi:hypothetical protein
MARSPVFLEDSVEGDSQFDEQQRNKLSDMAPKRSRRPESRSVTKAELRNLPLLASVALAVRCARRANASPGAAATGRR